MCILYACVRGGGGLVDHHRSSATAFSEMSISVTAVAAASSSVKLLASPRSVSLRRPARMQGAATGKGGRAITVDPALVKEMKKAVGEKSAELIKSDMVVGLGTGSTAAFMIEVCLSCSENRPQVLRGRGEECTFICTLIVVVALEQADYWAQNQEWRADQHSGHPDFVLVHSPRPPAWCANCVLERCGPHRRCD